MNAGLLYQQIPIMGLTTITHIELQTTLFASCLYLNCEPEGEIVSEAVDKLREDLKILEAMAAEMDKYLRSQVLFWPMSQSNLPRLTIGGYLMRQHRLQQLSIFLSETELTHRDKAMEIFSQALVEKVVRFEDRAHQEVHARLRQWGEYLKELHDRNLAVADYYHAHVQTRAMIAALIATLEMPPYELDERVTSQLETYDRVLRNFWQPGEFIWPEEWQAAYPQPGYWWLYGRSREPA